MKKFCNVTFVEEGQPGPDGVPWKLLRCSRCHGCFYRGKEEQRRHWRLHKRVCQPPSPVSPLADKQRYDAMGMNEAGAELMMLFNHKAFAYGPVWAKLLERVHHLFLTTESRSKSKMWSIRVEGNLPSWAVQELPALSDEAMEVLWATHGMASFLLSVDLTSEHMRRKREGGTPPLPEELYCYGSHQSDPAIHTNFGWASFICVWLMASSQRKLGGWQYRNTGFSKAAARRLAHWWKDPYTRASMSLLKDHHASNRQEWMPLAMMTAIDQSPIDDANPAEIAPGLTAKDAAMTIVRECFVFSPMRLQEMVHCLIDSYIDKPGAWRRFGAEDRAECALLAVERMLVRESPEAREGQTCFRASLNLGVELVLALTGMTTRGDVRDPGLRLEVLRRASRDRSERGTRRPGRLHPPDYFGICLDKIVEVHLPQLHALADAVRPLDIELPQELLHGIAHFICDPFRKESRDGVELTYLVGFVDCEI